MTPRRVRTAVLLALLLGASGAQAQIYRWVDDDGHAHYVGDREQVPERYRSQLPSEPAPEPAKPSPRAQSDESRRPASGECVLKVARTRDRPAITRSFPSCEACQKAVEAMRGPEPIRANCVPVDG